jgi:hypothetical protein
MNLFPTNPEDLPEDFKSKLEELWQVELEKSMLEAFTQIETMGIEQWITDFAWSFDRKKTVLTNMLQWYEEREEYERCALLHKGLNIISNS